MKKVLYSWNIISGFKTTRIWLLNEKAVDSKFSPNEGFTAPAEEEDHIGTIEENALEEDLIDEGLPTNENLPLDTVDATQLENFDNGSYYYVNILEEEQSGAKIERMIPLEAEWISMEGSQPIEEQHHISDFLVFSCL